MEELVAVRVDLHNRQKRYFITWGRIQHNVDGAPLESIVLRHAANFDLGGRAIRATLCPSLRDARNEPYFFEALFDLARKSAVRKMSYGAWKKMTDLRMKDGRDLYYLGRRRKKRS